MYSLFGFLNYETRLATACSHHKAFRNILRLPQNIYLLLVKNPISLDNSQCSCAFRNSLFAG